MKGGEEEQEEDVLQETKRASNACAPELDYNSLSVTALKKANIL